MSVSAACLHAALYKASAALGDCGCSCAYCSYSADSLSGHSARPRHSAHSWPSSRSYAASSACFDCGYFAMTSLGYFSSIGVPDRTKAVFPNCQRMSAARHMASAASCEPGNSSATREYKRHASSAAPLRPPRSSACRSESTAWPKIISSPFAVDGVTIVFAGSHPVTSLLTCACWSAAMDIFTHGWPSAWLRSRIVSAVPRLTCVVFCALAPAELERVSSRISVACSPSAAKALAIKAAATASAASNKKSNVLRFVTIVYLTRFAESFQKKAVAQYYRRSAPPQSCPQAVPLRKTGQPLWSQRRWAQPERARKTAAAASPA